MPLDREGVIKLGYSWREVDAGDYLPPTYQPPEVITAVGDEATKEIMACRISGKNFRLQKAELALYRKLSIPPPDCCFDQRHLARHEKRNRRQIYNRTCSECGAAILSTIPPDSKSAVPCERDFQNALN